MRDRFYPENLGKNTLCTFCQEHPETIAHLHLCRATTQAKGLIAQKTLDRSTITILHSAMPDDFTLKTAGISPRDQLTLAIFSLACWRARQHIRHSPPTDDGKTPTTAAHAIASSFLRLRQQVLKKTTRKAKNCSKARQLFLRNLSTLPSQSMHVYTDGSCFRSEKKAGAGVYLANFASSANAKEYLSFPLGDASNNVAELEGILKAMQYLLPRVANIQRVYFFVDNKYAINVSTKIWKAKCHRPLVRQIHLTLASLLKLTQVFFLWVPAHAMIYGNEVADYLAKRGAKAASSSFCPPDQKCLNDLLSPTKPAPAPENCPPAPRLRTIQQRPAVIPRPTPSRRSTRTRKTSHTRHAGVDYSFYQPPKEKRAPPVCPHGTPLSTPIDLPACCRRAAPEDITLPEGEVPEFPDLPPVLVDDL